MIRSRVTLAMIDAAATQAATRSPFQTASPGAPSPSTRKPSVSTYRWDVQPRAGHGHPERLDVGDVHAEPVALARLDADHRPGDGLPGDLVVAALPLQRGEQLGVRSPAICRAFASARMAAAATSGPAQAPRPASSAPATGSSPTRCSARS